MAPTVRRQNYEEAVGFLKLVAAGEAVIDETSSDSSDGEPVQAGVEFSSATRIFTRNTQDW